MWTTFIFECVLVMIAGSFGIVGNCLLIFKFIKLKIKVNFHWLMLALAIYDTIYISLCILLFAIPQIFEGYKIHGYYFYIAPKAVPLIQVVLTGSVYCTFSISLERYLTVCYPFYLSRKKWSSRRYILPIVLFSLLYNVTRFLELQTTCNGLQEMSHKQNDTHLHGKLNEIMKENKSQTANFTDYKESNYLNISKSESNSKTNEAINLGLNEIQYNCSVEFNSLRKNKYYYSIYIIGLNFVFNGFMPFSLIIVLNLLLYRKLKTIIKTSSFVSRPPSFITSTAEQKNRKSFDQIRTNENKRQRKVKLSEIMLAKVSLVIVFIFIICHSIKWIPNIYELVQMLSTEEENYQWPFWIDTISKISHFLTVFNSSTNFYIYWITHNGIPSSISCLFQQQQRPLDIEMRRISI